MCILIITGYNFTITFDDGIIVSVSGDAYIGNV